MKVFAIDCGQCGKSCSIEIDARYRNRWPSSRQCEGCRAINHLEWPVTIASEPWPAAVAITGLEPGPAPELPGNLADLVDWAAERDYVVQPEVEPKHRHYPWKTVSVNILTDDREPDLIAKGHAHVQAFPSLAHALDAAAKAAFSQWLQKNRSSAESSSR